MAATVDQSTVAAVALTTIGAGVAWAFGRARAFSVPPVAERRPHKVLFGDNGERDEDDEPTRGSGDLMDPPITREDDLFWLRSDDRDDEDVLAVVKAENEFALRHMQPTLKLQDELYKLNLSRILETQSGVPVLDNGFYYYRRTVKGLAYALSCRKQCKDPSAPTPCTPEEIDAPEHVYFDQNELAKGHGYCHVAGKDVSPSGRILAYAVDFSGAETYEIRFRDLETGVELPDVVKEAAGGVEWGRNDRVVFYSTQDEAKRSYRVWKHVLGGGGGVEDELLFEEKDALFSVHCGVTRCGRYLFISSESSETSEEWIADLDDSAADGGACAKLRPLLRVVEPRTPGLRYDADVFRGHLIVVHNDAGAKTNGELAWAPLDRPGRSHWTPVVPYEATVQVQYTSPFRDHLVVEGREGGSERIWILAASSFDTVASASASASVFADLVALPTNEDVYTVGASGNPEPNTSRMRFWYSSPATPSQTLELDVPGFLASIRPGTSTGRKVKEASAAAVEPFRRLLKQQPTPNTDPSLYATRRLFFSVPRDPADPASGTVDVPLSLVWRSDCFEGGEPRHAPTLLYGYGSYGISMDLGFSSSRLSLLDRGCLFVVAHVRGGGEMGRPWYEDMGKFEHKPNSFSDFVAAAEFLAKEGISNARRIAISGASAGGLLVGRALTLRPDLWCAVVGDVPFVDVLTTMCDETIPLTTGEWEEWGNPNEAEAYETIAQYSPMDTIPEGIHLPPVLLTAGLHDPRVGYWEPLKFAQRLRQHAAPGSGPVLLKTDMSAGHFSASDRYKNIREGAFTDAFILSRLGLA